MEDRDKGGTEAQNMGTGQTPNARSQDARDSYGCKENSQEKFALTS